MSQLPEEGTCIIHRKEKDEGLRSYAVSAGQKTKPW